MEALAPEEIVATVYEGLAGLPYFSSDDHVDPLDPGVAALRSQIRSAHALALVELAGHVAPTWRYVAVQQPLARRDQLAVLASLGGGQRSRVSFSGGARRDVRQPVLDGHTDGLGVGGVGRDL
jgi:hypothetical protein